ncbi:hypothetical protein BVL52_11090 [Pseudomonas oryzihabitans]|uniref:Uncharacterized protein n=1 Tax=Pseudomonas oryzihabitans TaxID=47885 RepID=A0ABX3IRR5_9PSED|nr:hypothetical protein BVL52_11090 [Pseudomonas psychrotolerans]
MPIYILGHRGDLQGLVADLIHRLTDAIEAAPSASIAALSASRLVCSAMPRMVLMLWLSCSSTAMAWADWARLPLS